MVVAAEGYPEAPRTGHPVTGADGVLGIEHTTLGGMWLTAAGDPTWLVCENETNTAALYGSAPQTPPPPATEPTFSAPAPQWEHKHDVPSILREIYEANVDRWLTQRPFAQASQA